MAGLQVLGCMNPNIEPLNIAAGIVPWMLSAYGNALANAYQILWDAFMKMAFEHWAISLFLVIFFPVASYFWFVTTGKWGWFGRVTYRYLKWGSLFVIGLVFGPKIFANDYFAIVLAVLWIVCYSATGDILKSMRARGV